MWTYRPEHGTPVSLWRHGNKPLLSVRPRDDTLVGLPSPAAEQYPSDPLLQTTLGERKAHVLEIAIHGDGRRINVWADAHMHGQTIDLHEQPNNETTHELDLVWEDSLPIVVAVTGLNARTPCVFKVEMIPFRTTLRDAEDERGDPRSDDERSGSDDETNGSDEENDGDDGSATGNIGRVVYTSDDMRVFANTPRCPAVILPSMCPVPQFRMMINKEPPSRSLPASRAPTSSGLATSASGGEGGGEGQIRSFVTRNEALSRLGKQLRLTTDESETRDGVKFTAAIFSWSILVTLAWDDDAEGCATRFRLAPRDHTTVLEVREELQEDLERGYDPSPPTSIAWSVFDKWTADAGLGKLWEKSKLRMDTFAATPSTKLIDGWILDTLAIGVCVADNPEAVFISKHASFENLSFEESVEHPVVQSPLLFPSMHIVRLGRPKLGNTESPELNQAVENLMEILKKRLSPLDDMARRVGGQSYPFTPLCRLHAPDKAPPLWQSAWRNDDALKAYMPLESIPQQPVLDPSKIKFRRAAADLTLVGVQRAPVDVLGGAALPPWAAASTVRGRGYDTADTCADDDECALYASARTPVWSVHINDATLSAMAAFGELYILEHKMLEQAMVAEGPADGKVGGTSDASYAARMQLRESAMANASHSAFAAADFIEAWLGSDGSGGRRQNNVSGESLGRLNLRAEDPLLLTAAGSCARIALRRMEVWSSRLAVLHRKASSTDPRGLLNARGVPWTPRSAVRAKRFVSALRSVVATIRSRAGAQGVLCMPLVATQSMRLEERHALLARRGHGNSDGGLTDETRAQINAMQRATRVAREAVLWHRRRMRARAAYPEQCADLLVLHRLAENAAVSRPSLIDARGRLPDQVRAYVPRVSPMPVEMTLSLDRLAIDVQGTRAAAGCATWATRRQDQPHDGLPRRALEPGESQRFRARFGASAYAPGGVSVPGLTGAPNSHEASASETALLTLHLVTALRLPPDDVLPSTSVLRVRYAVCTEMGWYSPIPTQGDAYDPCTTLMGDSTDHSVEVIECTASGEVRPVLVLMPEEDPPALNKLSDSAIYKVLEEDPPALNELSESVIYKVLEEEDGLKATKYVEAVSSQAGVHWHASSIDDLPRSLMWNVDRLAQAAALVDARAQSESFAAHLRYGAPMDPSQEPLLIAVQHRPSSRLNTLRLAYAAAFASVLATRESAHRSVRFVLDPPITETTLQTVLAVAELLEHVSASEPILTLMEAVSLALSVRSP